MLVSLVKSRKGVCDDYYNEILSNFFSYVNHATMNYNNILVTVCFK